MTHDDAMQTLLKISSKIDFFENLRDEEIKELILDVKMVSYKEGEIIFKEGDTETEHLYYLLRGKISIDKYINDLKNLQSRITTIDEPSLFGEMRFFTGEPRSATVESLDDRTLVIQLKFQHFVEDNALSIFYRNVICELSNKISKMNDLYC